MYKIGHNYDNRCFIHRKKHMPNSDIILSNSIKTNKQGFNIVMFHNEVFPHCSDMWIRYISYINSNFLKLYNNYNKILIQAGIIRWSVGTLYLWVQQNLCKLNILTAYLKITMNGNKIVSFPFTQQRFD